MDNHPRWCRTPSLPLHLTQPGPPPFQADTHTLRARNWHMHTQYHLFLISYEMSSLLPCNRGCRNYVMSPLLPCNRGTELATHLGLQRLHHVQVPAQGGELLAQHLDGARCARGAAAAGLQRRGMQVGRAGAAQRPSGARKWRGGRRGGEGSSIPPRR